MTRKKITTKTPGVEVELIWEEEHERPEDHFDDEAVQWVRDQLDRGNEWAWFTAHVRVTYKDILSADAYLGACSYKSEKDFIKESGYYDDMVDECLKEINDKLAKLRT